MSNCELYKHGFEFLGAKKREYLGRLNNYELFKVEIAPANLTERIKIA
jgi:hypothetical protein